MADERYFSDRYIQEIYKSRRGKLHFDPEKINTMDKLLAWEAEVREKAEALMQFPAEAYEEPMVRLLSDTERAGYHLLKMEIEPAPMLVVPFLLLVPDVAYRGGKVPGVLCFPGWDTAKEALAGERYYDYASSLPSEPLPSWSYPDENAMALHFVKEGYVALASDNFGTNELDGGYDRQQLALKMIMKGMNVVGITVFYRRAMLHWLMKQPYIDEKNIFLSAFSLGTETSMFLALLEPEIRGVIHNDFVSDNEERIIACFPPEDFYFGGHIHLLPGFHEWFSFPDLLAAMAPRPLIITEGGVTRDLERIREAYRICGAEENYTYYHYKQKADPAERPLDRESIPEGITNETYFEYANVLPEYHYFKLEYALPWIREKCLPMTEK